MTAQSASSATQAEGATGLGTPADGSMRIVVQNGEYWLCNKGDLAMLDVTVRRLRARWPRARIGVLTSAPQLLRAFVVGAEPVVDRGTGEWPSKGPIGRFAELAGPGVVGPPTVGWLSVRDRPRRYAGRVRRALVRRWHPGPEEAAPSALTLARRRPLPAALRTASLVMAQGGGYLTDVDTIQAHQTLNLLEYAADHGIPTAMVGQGIGPIDDVELLARAGAVLPRVDLIALREGLEGPGLLARLGVPADRVIVTGDDAVELAYAQRGAELGRDIGFCLRVADYSPVAAVAKDSVGRAVRGAARDVGADLVPLIVSEYRSEDRHSTLPLADGFPRTVAPLGRYATPHDLAARVSRCRVMVTGAYHLAVFALSQGIPVVGLSSSRYYDDKLRGLGAMFGGGLHLVRLDEPDLLGRLQSSIRIAWDEAPELREPLQGRAREQIEASRRAFERVFALVDPAPAD